MIFINEFCSPPPSAVIVKKNKKPNPPKPKQKALKGAISRKQLAAINSIKTSDFPNELTELINDILERNESSSTSSRFSTSQPKKSLIKRATIVIKAISTAAELKNTTKKNYSEKVKAFLNMYLIKPGSVPAQSSESGNLINLLAAKISNILFHQRFNGRYLS